MINISIDGHIHTKYCHHASGEMEEYVQHALDRNLEGIVFLEHLERGIDYFESTWLTKEDFEVYWAEGRKLQAKYGDRLAIGLGIEVGYNPDRVDEMRAFLAEYPWDRVGLSCHFLATDGGPHLNLVSRQKRNWAALGAMGIDRVVAQYLAFLREGVEKVPATVVCHFDAVLRHHPDMAFSDANIRLALELLDCIAQRGMALEVNTSGFVHRGEPYPSRFFLKEAAQRNIPLLAASDAHRPQDVGRFFDRLKDLP